MRSVHSMSVCFMWCMKNMQRDAREEGSSASKCPFIDLEEFQGVTKPFVLGDEALDTPKARSTFSLA